ncbi:hypothetical protein [Parafilimonas sp.]|uniref:hypothetical protein n=1 Tax=Parafilimonas sp. TaxID=1969739 RepID=UPI003F80F1F8
MDKDFIKVIKDPTDNIFIIEIYFSVINSTIRVDLKESEFLNFILQSSKLYNRETSTIKLNFSEDAMNNLIAKKREEELRDVSQKFKAIQTKLKAETVIFVPDTYVSLQSSEAITNACGDFMEALGFELETEDEPVFGSFFKKLKYIFSSTIGEEDLTKLYEKGKKALELKHIDLPTAEQTEKLANAADKLVSSLNGIDEGVIRCGALIVLKKIINGKPRLIIQQLSSEMIVLLDKYPKLIFNVNTIYELLTGDVKNDIDDSDSEVIKIA